MKIKLLVKPFTALFIYSWLYLPLTLFHSPSLSLSLSVILFQFLVPFQLTVQSVNFA